MRKEEKEQERGKEGEKMKDPRAPYNKRRKTINDTG